MLVMGWRIRVRVGVILKVFSIISDSMVLWTGGVVQQGVTEMWVCIYICFKCT